MIYICEICKREYRYESYAINCEKQHNCKHINKKYYFIDSCDDCRRFNTKGIECKCKDCCTLLGKVYFENIEEDDRKMLSIYNLIKV